MGREEPRSETPRTDNLAPKFAPPNAEELEPSRNKNWIQRFVKIVNGLHIKARHISTQRL